METDPMSLSQIPDQLVDQIFGNETLRPKLAELMQKMGLQGEPEDLPPTAKKALVATVLRRGKQQKEGVEPPKMPKISDDAAERMFADPNLQQMLTQIMTASGLSGDPAALPLATKKAIGSALVRQAAMVKAKRQTTEAGEVLPQIPDAAVQKIFEDPRAQNLINQVMDQNNLTGAPEDLPPETQKAVVQALLKAGAIQINRAASA